MLAALFPAEPGAASFSAAVEKSIMEVRFWLLLMGAAAALNVPDSAWSMVDLIELIEALEAATAAAAIAEEASTDAAAGCP